MINPHMLQPGYTKQFEPRFAGGKYYRPRVQVSGRIFHTRRIFGRASQAQEYSERVISRWCRLYDAAVVAKVQEPATIPSPAEPV